MGTENLEKPQLNVQRTGPVLGKTPMQRWTKRICVQMEWTKHSGYWTVTFQTSLCSKRFLGNIITGIYVFIITHDASDENLE